MEKYVEENKLLREQLKALLKTLLESERQSRERDIASDKLRESIMWLGQDLDALGVPSPYKQ